MVLFESEKFSAAQSQEAPKMVLYFVILHGHLSVSILDAVAPKW